MDPATMTDEELAKAIEEPVVEAPESTEAPKEEAAVESEQVIEEGQEQETEEVEETPAEEEKPVSRREQLRINDLLQKYPNLKERVTPQAPSHPQSDYIQNLDADPEIIKQLEADRRAVSDEAYFQGLKQAEVKDWKRDLKYENPGVLKDFPFLDPRNETSFKPAAADAMNQKYLRFIGYNAGDSSRNVPESIQYPDVSYREFVEGEMEFVDELANQKVAESTKNIARQAATTGLRPDGSSAKRLNLNQDPQNMTDEELDAAIGQFVPKK